MIFSIITPAFRQLDWLRLCVASVADQESSGLEIEHIVQDGGTPGIVEFLQKSAPALGLTIIPPEGDEALRAVRARASETGYTLIVYSGPDAGMYDAINKGIARMKGELWAWLNCDEQYLPGTLEYVGKWFQHHAEMDILCGDALLTNEEGEALSYRRIIPPHWQHTRLVHLASLSCASFYRSSVVERGGIFDTSWRAIGDAEWMARLIKKGLRIGSCDKLLSVFAFTGQNTSETPLAKEEGARWRAMPDAPDLRLGVFVIWNHRFRKWKAGSYKRRSVTYAIYRSGGCVDSGRIIRSVHALGWWWPSVEGLANSEEGATIRVLGAPLLVTSYEGLTQRLCQIASEKMSPVAVDFANTHVVTMRRHEPWFERLGRAMNLTVPDGMPLVWVMNQKGATLKDRVYGPTFTREFLATCPKEYSHYLVGGSEECGRRFRERMLAENPNLNFIGGYHGMCSEEGVLTDDQAVLKELQEKKPDFIWVGLGTPKQYAWIHRVKPLLEYGVILAVGFAFDVNAGMKPDAPAWMQPLGLTWLYRLASEPGRLAGRYLKWNSLFLFYLVKEFFENRWLQRRLTSDRYRKWKLRIRGFVLKVADLFASEITDCMTGAKLGRGLVIAGRGYPIVIGHPGLPPLIPRFLPQKRLTYWKQKIGFTTHPRPDYPRLEGIQAQLPASDHPRVMNLLLTHQIGEPFERVREYWSGVASEESLWVAFGGTQEDFEWLDYPRKIYIDDPKLRKRDNQREKQCYSGIFRALSSVVDREQPDYIYLCEYDHLPLIPDLNRRQVQAIQQEEADVMGHWLYRVDGTGHYHELYHEDDADFLPFWRSLSRREEKGVILSMFGSGSFWTRDAFLALAAQLQSIECYLEIYLPTLAHHLGFRVRGWRESDHLISNLPSSSITIESARSKGCWTVHPVKEIPAKS